MSITLELAPEVEQLAKAKAETRGVTLEEYLPSLIAYAMQQEDWAETTSEESLGHLTMLAAEPLLSRIWNRPEEDAAWKYPEDREHGTV